MFRLEINQARFSFRPLPPSFCWVWFGAYLGCPPFFSRTALLQLLSHAVSSLPVPVLTLSFVVFVVVVVVVVVRTDLRGSPPLPPGPSRPLPAGRRRIPRPSFPRSRGTGGAPRFARRFRRQAAGGQDDGAPRARSEAETSGRRRRRGSCCSRARRADGDHGGGLERPRSPRCWRCGGGGGGGNGTRAVMLLGGGGYAGGGYGGGEGGRFGDPPAIRRRPVNGGRRRSRLLTDSSRSGPCVALFGALVIVVRRGLFTVAAGLLCVRSGWSRGRV